MEEMTIGEVAELAGVEPSTLRYYESIGILPPPKRVSGQRRYTSDVLLRMAFIGVAKEAGFTMSDVGALLHGFSEDTAPSDASAGSGAIPATCSCGWRSSGWPRRPDSP